ncbi:g6729 [Coccomyxa elongata]
MARWVDLGPEKFAVTVEEIHAAENKQASRLSRIEAARRQDWKSVNKGVSWYHKGSRWEAKLGSAGNQRLGFFDSEMDAARAVDRASREVYGHATLVDLDKDGVSLATALPEKQRNPCACPYVGVSVVKGGDNKELTRPFKPIIWLPDIREQRNLGSFSTAMEAACTYDDAVRQYNSSAPPQLRKPGIVRCGKTHMPTMVREDQPPCQAPEHHTVGQPARAGEQLRHSIPCQAPENPGWSRHLPVQSRDKVDPRMWWTDTSHARQLGLTERREPSICCQHQQEQQFAQQQQQPRPPKQTLAPMTHAADLPDASLTAGNGLADRRSTIYKTSGSSVTPTLSHSSSMNNSKSKNSPRVSQNAPLENPIGIAGKRASITKKPHHVRKRKGLVPGQQTVQEVLTKHASKIARTVPEQKRNASPLGFGTAPCNPLAIKNGDADDVIIISGDE